MRAALVGLTVLLAVGSAAAYPIDAWKDTGIARLEAYRLAQEGEVQGIVLYWGAQLYAQEIQLRLSARPPFHPPAPDPDFTQKLIEVLGDDADGYGIAVIDISDPDAPLYAAHQPDRLQNPGSVGKIMVGLAWFQALADIYPDDVAARRKILRETIVTADEFIKTDTHTVPFWTPGDPTYERRPIEIGDTGNLNTWLDWMLSSSSNAAAAELQSQLLLVRHFGPEYPPSPEQAQAYFRDTSKAELTRQFLDAITTPATRNGLDLAKLRQGSFFSRTGKSRVPGTSSHASAGELLRFMLLMEQGKLVDPWSSRELKRFLYLTDKRIRYAANPALWDFAVYFKSGSFYKCSRKPGTTCEKYAGDVFNYMNSVTMVENVDQKAKIHYIAVVLSNVQGKNSVNEHKALAGRVHRLILTLHPEPESESEEMGGGEGEPAPAPEDVSPAGPPSDAATTSQR
ncbi:MAG: hypothetical protein JRG85_08185 [Deltaproteobacteria bacterium]|nr:hypothetical protein [Deltaproteobacteria bacterium]